MSLAFVIGGWEMVVILATILMLVGRKKLPEIARGIGLGIYHFRKSTREVASELGQAAHGAGESLGGIYGKTAAQALTPHNQVAELYDPAVFQKENETTRARNRRYLMWLVRRWRQLCGFFGRLAFRRSVVPRQSTNVQVEITIALSAKIPTSGMARAKGAERAK